MDTERPIALLGGHASTTRNSCPIGEGLSGKGKFKFSSVCLTSAKPLSAADNAQVSLSAVARPKVNSSSSLVCMGTASEGSTGAKGTESKLMRSTDTVSTTDSVTAVGD